jgi:hypothetical protein
MGMRIKLNHKVGDEGWYLGSTGSKLTKCRLIDIEVLFNKNFNEGDITENVIIRYKVIYECKMEEFKIKPECFFKDFNEAKEKAIEISINRISVLE